MKTRCLAAGLMLALLACAGAESEPERACLDTSLGTSHSALQAVDRKIIGGAAPYDADGTLRMREGELAASQRVRREVAWHTVSKVLAAVPIAEQLPNAPVPHARIPSWQTWHDQDDLRRVFLRLYEGLSSEQKESRAPFSDAALDETFLWNTSAVEEHASWNETHYLAYLHAIDEATEVAGLGGISRVSYSPAAARHILKSYPQVLKCRSEGVPPAHEVGRLVLTPVAREPVAAGACERRAVGAYAIGEDESLQAVLEEGHGATLVMQAGDERCDAAAGTACEIHGPATVQIAVLSGAAPLRSVVVVTRQSTHPPWAACLDGAFPIDAVVVKADYRRADFGMTMPVYTTSAEALEQRLSGSFSWETANGEADPNASDIYTLTLPNGARYRLAALHIMTKELDHWQWITLWWSPSPSEDFGADRPLNLAALSYFGHYKMCTAMAFQEGDPLAGGGFEQSHPSLAEALATTHAGVGGPTWCSNPYLEVGHGNANTNCVGCHQHGGTQLLSEHILELDEHGRAQSRNNFPTDYSWAIQNDGLESLFADTELYYLGPP